MKVLIYGLSRTGTKMLGENLVRYMQAMGLETERTYWLQHGTQTTEARIKGSLVTNEIGSVQIEARELLTLANYTDSTTLGSVALIDPTTHQTVAIGTVRL